MAWKNLFDVYVIKPLKTFVTPPPPEKKCLYGLHNQILRHGILVLVQLKVGYNINVNIRQLALERQVHNHSPNVPTIYVYKLPPKDLLFFE